MDIAILSRPPELPPDFDLGFIEIPLHAAPRPEFDGDHTASGARPGPGHIKGIAPPQGTGVEIASAAHEEGLESAPAAKRRLRHPRPPSINETI
ncbi:MAG: hypothetical protein ORN98_00125, partial [Alphaproteobacteria bacterium]|nr:hypothetical protein [Alphaproteobacteria bacterium]